MDQFSEKFPRKYIDKGKLEKLLAGAYLNSLQNQNRGKMKYT